MQDTQRQFGYGWLPDLPDTRDLMYAVPYPIMKEIPKKIDLRSVCPPVLMQGSLGSCTANAIASAHQFNQMKQSPIKNFQPSRLFIYYNEREMEGTVPYDSGAYIRDGFKSIANQGVCPEVMWPYIIPQFTTKPLRACYEDAMNHQAIQYLRLTQTLSQLKGCLAEGYPFVFGFTVYESFDQVDKSGIVNLPSKSEKVRGGHAVLAVGYDDDLQRFIVQNSWDTDWGDMGYFYMPYSYLTDESLSADFWTLRLVEQDDQH